MDAPTPAVDSNVNPNPINVQHVNKKSSDELLRKFAELEEEAEARAKELKLQKQRKRNARRGSGQGSESPSNNGGGGLVERKRLLPPATLPRRSTLLRQLGIGRSQLIRAREIRNRSLLGAIEKTWRRTMEGASRVFMEKHYNRHRRLISDVV
ncbi:hypothetical protein SLEP1_g42923 [Rubroshorea leprosula]|uniref:Uncharacterized protein n=1 Tax=Rubroshorea leprosula TaxID=152421 RepID=A0AAV5LBY4_9ROSI|nr:hypothetical protein SLEP1_g42923 [Rubroshorea leprosula]